MGERTQARKAAEEEGIPNLRGQIFKGRTVTVHWRTLFSEVTVILHGTATRNYWVIVQWQTRYIIRRRGWAESVLLLGTLFNFVYSLFSATKNGADRLPGRAEKKVEEAVLLSEEQGCVALQRKNRCLTQEDCVNCRETNFYILMSEGVRI